MVRVLKTQTVQSIGYILKLSEAKTDKQKIKAEESLKKANVSLESAKDRVKEAKNRLEAYAQMLG